MEPWFVFFVSKYMQDCYETLIRVFDPQKNLVVALLIQMSIKISKVKKMLNLQC